MKTILTLILAMLASINFAFAAVDLNSATAAELEAVKGLGPAKAKAIVDYRTKNGPFKSVDDLKGVKGFGAKSVAKMQGELTVGGSGASVPKATPAAVAPVAKPPKPAAPGSK